MTTLPPTDLVFDVPVDTQNTDEKIFKQTKKVLFFTFVQRGQCNAQYCKYVHLILDLGSIKRSVFVLNHYLSLGFKFYHSIQIYTISPYPNPPPKNNEKRSKV